ncbi:head decoration protein [Kitasatospora aureofaciens]|uniref:head decoration protein n=1 Tax=Kitasatospora aureofaciens TaxID=1894 RepID=UPI001C43D8FD|nr:head decoration protein [Kitasatospora aureofaciens]MBV6699491.1 head decoration protein [Kitasatospora aureofaciens]
MTVQPISPSASYTADRSRLGSLHGIDSTETITLDITKFTAGTHYQASTDPIQPYSRVLSGVPVARITASDLAATDGRQRLAGLVFADAVFSPGQTKVAAAMLWLGVVRAATAPGGIDPAKVTPTSAGPLIRCI